ncbi:MAG: hypothetical protein ACI97B_001639 [Verrucomicrobiales bacterium]|jgi:hypothetical protein
MSETKPRIVFLMPQPFFLERARAISASVVSDPEAPSLPVSTP